MPEVIIEEVVSTVRAVDGTSLLHPATLGRIVQAVLSAVDAKNDREERRKRDAKIGDDDGRQANSGGVAERG
jgi:hypothetical protein